MKVGALAVLCVVFISCATSSHHQAQSLAMSKKDWTEFQNEWIDFHGTEYQQYVLKNADRFKAAPRYIYYEAMGKWWDEEYDSEWPISKPPTPKVKKDWAEDATQILFETSLWLVPELMK